MQKKIFNANRARQETFKSFPSRVLGHPLFFLIVVREIDLCYFKVQNKKQKIIAVSTTLFQLRQRRVPRP